MNQSKPQPYDDAPVESDIHELRHHKLDALKAKKTLKQLVNSAEDSEVAKAIRLLPLTPYPGIPRNRLLAVNSDGSLIFVINMKTGESYYL